MPNNVYLDYETIGSADITKCGAYVYAEHPETDIAVLTYRIGHRGDRRVWHPAMDEPEDLYEEAEKGSVFIAHNAQFEDRIWNKIMVPRYFAPPVSRWFDTMALCAYRSIPLKLEKAAEALGLPTQKWSAGKKMIRKLIQAFKEGGRPAVDKVLADPVFFEAFTLYCSIDVDVSIEIHRALGKLPPHEVEVFLHDWVINHRGFRTDREVVMNSIRMVEEYSAFLTEELEAITGIPGIKHTQVAKLKSWCEANGVQMTSFAKDLLRDMLDDPVERAKLPVDVRRVLEIRQELGLTSTGKLIRLRDMACKDGRVRGNLQYHGAGTGRFAGRGVQIQNYPRGTIKHIGTVLKLLRQDQYSALEDIYGNPVAAISSALRGMTIPADGHTFYCADFSNIEVRVLMALAREEEALFVFAENDAGRGRDIYCVFADVVYGYTVYKDQHPDERQTGKMVVLGSGFQAAGIKLAKQAKKDFGIDLANTYEEGTLYYENNDPNKGRLPETREEKAFARGQQLVKLYRTKYWKVPVMWKESNDAAIRAVETGRPQQAGFVQYEFIKDKHGRRWLACALPAGRAIWYAEPFIHTQEVKKFDDKGNIVDSYLRRSLQYHGQDGITKQWRVQSMYGGKAVENYVQGIARDFMVHSMAEAERAGYPVILTVHDEVLCEVARTRNEFESYLKVMASSPGWATDMNMPLAVEGWQGDFYRKG